MWQLLQQTTLYNKLLNLLKNLLVFQIYYYSMDFIDY